MISHKLNAISPNRSALTETYVGEEWEAILRFRKIIGGKWDRT
jgi:hypothetical protein